MKLKFIPYYLLIVILSFVVACSKNNTDQDANAIDMQGAVVSLYKCLPLQTNGSVSICFDSLITDSRCPENVVCVWGGYAMIKVSFYENNNIHRFKLLLPPGQRNKSNDTTINGYKIILTGLNPYPNTSLPVPTTNNIKASFDITH